MTVMTAPAPAMPGTQAEILSVGMGETKIAKHPDTLQCVLGSCIGVCIANVGMNTAVLAHVMLPDSSGRDGAPGKFADTAIPHLLGVLRENGLFVKSELIVKLAGGAQMFNRGGPMQIGKANADAVKAALAKADLSVDAEHIGGAKGRKVSVNSETGLITVSSVGEANVEI